MSERTRAHHRDEWGRAAGALNYSCEYMCDFEAARLRLVKARALNSQRFHWIVNRDRHPTQAQEARLTRMDDG